MENFFSRLFRQTSFHRQDDDKTPVDDSLDKEKEDEGYILVGQTKFEKKEGHEPRACKISDSLPSYSQALTEECTIQQSPPAFDTMAIPPSPVSDIPFKFHPLVDTQLYIKEMFQGINLQTKQFDWGKYSHDFTNEKLCLRDLRCGEEANIDEFSSSLANTSESEPPGENLIKL